MANDQQAESARTRLMEANLAMVVSIADRYRDGGIDVLDLIQKGNEGLLLALQSFAENSTESFSTHAAAHINASIEKAIADSRPAGE